MQNTKDTTKKDCIWPEVGTLYYISRKMMIKIMILGMTDDGEGRNEGALALNQTDPLFHLSNINCLHQHQHKHNINCLVLLVDRQIRLMSLLDTTI